MKVVRSHHDNAMDMLLNALVQYRNRQAEGITLEYALYCLDVAIGECEEVGIFEQDDS